MPAVALPILGRPDAGTLREEPSLPLLGDLSLPQLEEWVRARGWPAFRARQLWGALYRRLETDPRAVHELPREARDELAGAARLSGLAVHAHHSDPAVGTDKLLFRLADGATIETVVMRHERAGAPPRATVCVSTQAGCALACAFCATGKMGWARDLTPGEVVGQVLHAARLLRPEGRQVTNVVFMGMGEPLLPYDATLAAIRTLTHPQGFGLGARHITISTAGVVPGILRLAGEGLQVGLAVSLHGPDDETRGRIMPINKRWPVAEVMDAVRAYSDRTHRRVTFEYIMIDGVNDSTAQAARLAALLRGLLCHVNLIPFNPVEGIAMARSSPHAIAAFRDVLARAGLPVTVRDTRGGAIRAACGQLQTEARRRSRPTP
ncbi:MAG: 23S rRNA (adenine(2503)-C(2))-methyltransferase RlmN [Chloroflexota bacterium]